MSKDVYVSLSGASASMKQLDMLAQNMANVNTDGFKEYLMTFTAKGNGGSPLSEVYTTPVSAGVSMADGTLIEDGDPYHLALQGDGYFAVDTPEGLRMTRVGNFTPDLEGYLVTPQGWKLLGTGGPIQLPTQPPEIITIDSTGRVMGDVSGELDTLQLVTSQEAMPLGEGLWDPKDLLEPATPNVTQGALEASNVNALEVMTDLIQATRHFEAMQKAMQASDEMDSRLNRTGGQ